MVFTSLNFIVFLLITVVLFYMCTQRSQRILLLAANYVFYMWMKPVLGLFLLAGTVVTYLAGLAIQRRLFGCRRVWTVIGVVAMLGQLAVFKYADFFLSGVGFLLGREIPGLELLHLALHQPLITMVHAQNHIPKAEPPAAVPAAQSSHETNIGSPDRGSRCLFHQ